MDCRSLPVKRDKALGVFALFGGRIFITELRRRVINEKSAVSAPNFGAAPPAVCAQKASLAASAAARARGCVQGTRILLAF